MDQRPPHDGRDGRDGRDAFGVAYVVQEINTKVDRIFDHLDAYATKTEVAFLSARVDDMVPRSEQIIHNQRDEDRARVTNDHFIAIEKRIDVIAVESEKRFDTIDEKLEASAANRLPPWFIPAVVGLGGILVTIAGHFWK